MPEIIAPSGPTARGDTTRTAALIALCAAILAIAIEYAAAFGQRNTPVWAPWLLALGIPISLGAIMILGAARGEKGIGPLKLPFLFVVAVLAIGFCAALALPATESPFSRLWLGLPARAAAVIYGIGLLPIVVLPVAYALTFETQTLSAEDVERVRAMGQGEQGARIAREVGVGSRVVRMIGMSIPGALLQIALPSAAQPAVIAVGVLYFSVVVAISVWAARRTRTARDFFVAGKGIGLVALTVASVSVSVSGFAFIGGPGFIYAVGLGAMYIVLPAAVTNVMGAWVLAKRMRLLGEARNLITIPDAIGARYRSPAAQGLAAVAMLVGIVGYMATNALAMGVVINSIFGVGLGWGIWIGMGVTLAYSASGGILAGIYNDVFQGTLMAVASVLVFLFVLGYGGGLGEISRTILAHDPTFLGPWGKLTPLAALSFFFVFSMGSLGQPQAVHKYYMLRDPLQLKWYPLLKTLGLVLVLLLYFSVGVGVKAFVLDGRLPPLANPDQATPSLLLNVTPIILAALVFSGVAAATMSAANSFINIGAAIVTHDLPIAFGRRVRNELGWGRAITVLIAVAAAITAQRSGTMVAFLGIFGWGLFASTLVPALAVGLNWQGATRAGAIASITTGLVVTLALETAAYRKAFTFPAGVTASAVAMVASFLVFFLVSWLTRRAAPLQLDPDVQLVMEL